MKSQFFRVKSGKTVTPKMEFFSVLVNKWKPYMNIAKNLNFLDSGYNSFSWKNQLLAEAVTEICSAEICRCSEIAGPNLETITLKESIS